MAFHPIHRYRTLPPHAKFDPIWKLEPNPLVRRFARTLVDGANGNPILDLGCGSGRHAFHLAGLGSRVIALDRDLAAVWQNVRLVPWMRGETAERLELAEIELDGRSWPFRPASLGGIVAVHFPGTLPFRKLSKSLAPGGRLLVQTIPGHGSNYLDLPKAGELRTAALENSLEVELYKERLVGPPAAKAVTVQLLGRRA